MKTVPRFGILLGFALFPILSLAQESLKTGSPASTEAGGFSVNTKKDSIGDVQVGFSKSDTLTVTNTGTSNLNISSVKSSNAQFTVSPVSASISAGANRKFVITFAPITAGAQSSFIVFTHNGSTSPDTVTSKGNGTVPTFLVNRKTLAYGIVVIATGKPDSVSVTNTGTAALVISSVTSTNARYSVNPTSGTIQPGAKSTFRITFTPTANGLQNGNIVFLHNAPTVRDTVAVSGTGTGFSVNRRSVAFGNVPVASPSKDSVVVTNAGATTLTISSVASSNGTFTVSPAGASIAAAASAKFYITFTPANTTAQTGNIVFTHNASSSPDTVAVSGTGIAAGFSVTRRSVPFGTVALGGSKLDSVVVTNIGGVALVIGSVTSSNGTFSVNPANATLQPAQARTFYITFTPANTTAQTGNIVFLHNASSSPDTVAVSGTGTLAGFALDRRTVPFGLVLLGQNRLDSVTVSDTGNAALVISSVASSNGAFTVNPANATIQPSQSRKFYLTFTPANTNPQTGNVVFNHNAPGLHDTLAVSGTGGAPGFLVNRKTVPFGSVVVGGSRLDSVTVSDTGSAPLVISSIASGNGTFTVNPANATIQPAGTRTFFITFTPLNANPQSGNLVFNHNAPGLHDTVTVSGTGVAPLAAPLLLAPANGSTGQALPVALTWGTVSGATGYWLQMGTDPSFNVLAISDSTLVAAGRQVSGLPQNTQYYWRVSTRNAAGPGPFSSAWTLTTVASGAVSGTVGFSGDVSSTSYRMFGLPGIGTRKVGDILSGTQKTDWRMIRDNGRDTTYPAYYVDLTADSALKTGEGYWLLQRKDLNISRTDTLPPLATDGTYGIPLHSGWNMITDPFNSSVLRTAVIAANGLPLGTLFWEHVGATRTSGGTTFDPFKGYYFDNGGANLTTLKIPYPFGTTVAKLAKAPGVDWRVELVFDSDINTDRDNYIGIAPSVGPGR
ncbi:MAG TPA: choice-of-anchor D domain-containing protein, partial [Bacteroidota bacterium]